MTSPLTRDPAILEQWIGRTQSINDQIDINRVRLMQATLDHQAILEDGDPLPPLWHWIFCLEGKPTSQLGHDGHPALGDFLPPVDLPRRMWAGGRVSFHAPLTIGKALQKTSTVTSVTFKEGRSGLLCFVTVLHELKAEGGTLLIEEEQDLVYREPPQPPTSSPKKTSPAAAPAAESSQLEPQWQKTIAPSSTLLFRYSALTFNGHRIHYDRPYARDVENYPDLVFHGPLTATLLAGLAQDNMPAPLKSFSFRGVAPLFDTADFTICGRHDAGEPVTVWAQTPQGTLAMKAEAT